LRQPPSRGHTRRPGQAGSARVLAWPAPRPPASWAARSRRRPALPRSIDMQPISPELREWIVAQLAAGHSVAALRASMHAAGWRDDATDAALAGVGRAALGGAPAVAAPAEPAGPARTEMPGPDLEGAPLYI